MSAAILGQITELLRVGGSARSSSIHGEAHWMRVAVAGLRLLEAEPMADAELVLFFSLRHDARRENDGHDPGHGPRAATLARALNERLLRLSSERLECLVCALQDHTTSCRSHDATMAVCLDADRLNLWRVGITPRARLLSTTLARRPEVIRWARELQTARYSWEEVASEYAALMSPLHQQITGSVPRT